MKIIKTITKKFRTGWVMTANIHEHKVNYFAYVEMVNKKRKETENYNTLWVQGAQKLDVLVKDLEGFEIEEQVEWKYGI